MSFSIKSSVRRQMAEYSIEPSENGTYITLTVVGEIKGGLMMKYIAEAHAMGRKLGTRRYLVDVREARNTDSVLDNYNFAYEDIKKAEGIDPHTRVAALISPGDTSHDFVATVLNNAGAPLKIFDDPQMAVAYLKE